ncbi:unnamed protein product [Caenorhabditis angaria]|uniref:Uncharacterized protein n=1 Tax=Caenorhabditis angaria TaxID=860376 RepID=A0A9P1IBA6_9PELO|nr:unnamed protein product [Caenorhabditis angaria]
MQRIQSWFDQLSLNRDARRRRRRNTSRVNDATRDKVANKSQTTRGPVTLTNFNFPPPPPTMQGFDVNSMPRRNKIRTNPWISSSSTSGTSSMTSSTRNWEPRNLPASLCVASPDTSMCSSGYASHDSSPDTSMVWGGKYFNFQQHQKCANFIDDEEEELYHELILGSTSSYSNSPESREDEPIYAEPWSSSQISPRDREPIDLVNCNYRPFEPIYAQPFGVISEKRREFTDDELARDEFLHELDQQILELQLRSEELREMVERARHQPRNKEYVPIPKLECTFELAI